MQSHAWLNVLRRKCWRSQRHLSVKIRVSCACFEVAPREACETALLAAGARSYVDRRARKEMFALHGSQFLLMIVKAPAQSARCLLRRDRGVTVRFVTCAGWAGGGLVEDFHRTLR